jgi:hypothetical protein
MLFLQASTQTPISGVVNDYYSVVEIVSAQSCIRLNNTNGLGSGDRALLVQMKGAAINTTNTSAFGDTASLAMAGNYEMITICSIRGDTAFLVFDLIDQYSPSSKLQLVRIPTYSSAIVTDTLKAAPWNNTTGTGGVLAIFVEDELIVNAPISADSMGYRGGAYKTSSSTCSNFPGVSGYTYNPGNTLQNGAYKGEGVAEVAASQNGGRGAPANGGGGGNNHNNAGAGGANLNAGGNGGGNSSASGCTQAVSGRGGKPLRNHGRRKIFMGGGGGAGHANNGLIISHGGGSGGGIIFIKANRATINHRISANGRVGGNSLSDGASGGGAGGTIILDINEYYGTGAIQAIGGAGGNSNDNGNLNYCYGAGGGGSGGVIYFSGITPANPVSVAGGPGGNETGRDASCAPIVPPTAGSSGTITQNYDFRLSTFLNINECSIPLASVLLYFKTTKKNEAVELTWEILNTEDVLSFQVERGNSSFNMEPLFIVDPIDNISKYAIKDETPIAGNNFYRLKIIEKNQQWKYSTVKKIFIGKNSSSIRIYPNPAQHMITISGTDGQDEMLLYDISGKLIIRKRLNANQSSIEVNLPCLTTGIYVIRIGQHLEKLAVY